MATDAQGQYVYVPADVDWEDDEEESTMPSDLMHVRDSIIGWIEEIEQEQEARDGE